MFTIFSQLNEELEDFESNKVQLFNHRNSQRDLRRLSKVNNSFLYSQRETIELIDLYYNSKFQTGEIDSEGQRKVFLNICQFKVDVAQKMIDLDVKDIIFIPENSSSRWQSWFLAKEFMVWTQDNNFSEFLNDISVDMPKYGSVVVKNVKGKLHRVPIHNLKNSQDAKSLDDAHYVIEEHRYKLYKLKEEAEENGWDISNIDINSNNFDDDIIVYERYGMTNLATIKEFEGEKPSEADYNDMVRSISLLTLEKIKDQSGKELLTGNLLFIEKIKKLPYQEAHWKKQDGRWLGLGEVENQFENQLSMNALANVRRRALLWSSKKVFQSSDDLLVRNLIRDVKDGDVLKISSNGSNISQVNLSTQSIAEFASDERLWTDNSNQKSFTFEVATGESLPSGTPFRLGAILSSAVKSHFELKREIFGLFVKDLIKDFLVPEFKRGKGKRVVSIFADEVGFNDVKEATIQLLINQRVKNNLLDLGIYEDPVMIRQEIEQKINSEPMISFELPKEFYDDVEYRLKIVVTNEEIDTNTKLETLKTILQLIASNPTVAQDPNLRKILDKAVSLTGENLDSLIPKTMNAIQQVTPPNPASMINQISALSAKPSNEL